ncbi:MAG: hypothetical protein J5636_09545 [Clostridiales bacterium]|nr:hypothetical protein [Clostridiales bacterium]
MARNCPGCGAPLVYDPGFDSLVCETCGNIIDPQTLSDADDFYLNMGSGDDPVALEDLLEEEEITGEMYDCHIHQCTQCGGEVIVSGTEVSTRCVYCGATTLVFNRISKEVRPDYVIPFKITKEEALANVKKKLLSGPFIPRFFKKIDPECVRGIYVPYYLYDGVYSDTQRFMIGNEPIIRDGSCEFHDLPVEACKVLADKTSELLDPYYMNEKVDFDTSYLMGFYSNIADLEPRAAKACAGQKARDVFDWEMMQQPPTSFRKKRVLSVPKYEMERTSQALLPVWFITLDKDGTPYTFLVNGQTGKVVGTVPWNRVLAGAIITTIFVALASLITILFFKEGIYKEIVDKEFDLLTHTKKGGENIIYAEIGIGFLAASGATTLLGIGFSKFKRVLDNLNRTKSVVTFIFSKKRQGEAK